MTAISSKSYWHISKTLATQTGMTNKWLRMQGLISVRDLWSVLMDTFKSVVCCAFVNRLVRTPLLGGMEAGG